MLKFLLMKQLFFEIFRRDLWNDREELFTIDLSWLVYTRYDFIWYIYWNFVFNSFYESTY